MIKLNPPGPSEVFDDIWHKCTVCARYYPECQMVEYEGAWYSQECFDWRFRKKLQDETWIEVFDDPKERA